MSYLEATYTFTPAGRVAGDPNVRLYLAEVDDDGDETPIGETMQFLCDDHCYEAGCDHDLEHCEYGPPESCELTTPEGLADYMLGCLMEDRGIIGSRRSPWTFDNLDGTQRSADVELVGS